MDPEPLRQILDRQLKRIRKAADTEDTDAGRETGLWMAIGARRLLQAGTLWGTVDDIKTAAKASSNEHRARASRRRRERRQRAEARNRDSTPDPLKPDNGIPRHDDRPERHRHDKTPGRST